MKTLIIGGTGLISTEVTRALVERGDSVTLFNRGSTVPRFEGETELIVGDRKDHETSEKLIRGAGPWDCVIDMICSDPADAESLVRAARDETEQLIFCSTTNVYPKPADSYPVAESHRLGADFANGQHKIRCEEIHREAEAAGAFAATIVRPGHTYGESGVVLHSLGRSTAYLDRIRRGKPIVVHGDGGGLWSALHAADVAAVFAACAGNTEAHGCTYNATGQEWMTWNQYNEAVAEALGCPRPELVHIPTDSLTVIAPDRAAQCARSFQHPGVYDTTAASRDLGFEPRISFVEGTRRVIAWLEAHGGIDPWESDQEYEGITENWRAVQSRLSGAEA